MFVSNLVNIAGKSAVPFVTGVSAVVSAVLESGIYDVYVSVDTFIRVAKSGAISPDRGQDVTTANGYRIAAGNTVPVFVPVGGYVISAIAGGAGAMIIHRID